MEQREVDLLQMSWVGRDIVTVLGLLNDLRKLEGIQALEDEHRVPVKLEYSLVVPSRWKDLVDLQMAFGMSVVYADVKHPRLAVDYA